MVEQIHETLVFLCFIWLGALGVLYTVWGTNIQSRILGVITLVLGTVNVIYFFK
jgi:hypothetical protein